MPGDGEMLSLSLSFASSASGTELVLLARMKAPKSEREESRQR